MKKILIPIDLTAAALNAAIYATALGQRSQVQEILFTANSHLSVFEQLYPSPDYLPASAETQQEREEILQHRFNGIKSYLADHLHTTISLRFEFSRSPLIEGIMDLISTESPDLMVVGSEFVNGLIGNHLIAIAKASTIPVLIIPEKAAYQHIETALVPYNASNLPRLKLLNSTHIFDACPKPSLLLLKVKDNDHQRSEAVQDKSLQDLLGDYSYELASATNQDILVSIAAFLNTVKVQLIVALPGEHGYFYQLSHRSVTSQLARTDHLPILILQP